MSLGDPEQVFLKGNQLYMEGQYDKAVKEYENILQLGKHSGPIYYNLANAYFRKGDYGRAILNYERAERLMPRDADVKANYSFARSVVKDKILPKKGIWQIEPYVRYYTSFTINELTWISSFLFLMFLTVLFRALTNSIKLRYKLIVSISILILLFLNTATVYHKYIGLGKTAIVVPPRADVLYGPFDTATKFFTVHEGAVVRILESKGDWKKIRRSDNKAGWVNDKAVEAI